MTWNHTNVVCTACMATFSLEAAGPLNDRRCTPCFLSNRKTFEPMQIKQAPSDGVCNAMRCKTPAARVVPLQPFLQGLADTKRKVVEAAYPSGDVELCEMCVAKATVAHKLSVPPTVVAKDPAFGGHTSLSFDGTQLLPLLHMNRETETLQFIIPTSGVDAEIAENERYATETTSLVQSFEIATREEYSLVAELLAEVKGRAKALAERREQITKPMLAALESARALFRAPEKALAATESAIKSAIAAFVKKEEENKRKALEDAAQAVQNNDAQAVAEALERVVTTKNVPGVTTRQVRKYEITNADAVPRVLCSPDDRKIREYMTRYADSTGVDGIRFYTETVVASRSL